MARFTGQPAIRGTSEALQMTLLTFAAIGISFVWGFEMTYCTPYLLNLGLSKSSTSLVWVAGPLSGLIVMPIVGVVSDASTSRWGRRRPLIVVGTGVVALCLLVLGFTREIVGWFFQEELATTPTIVLAVAAIYATDFAINAVMSCSRSLVADTLPMEKQQAGAAWFSRMSSIGHVFGYAAGALDLVSTFGGFLGATQISALAVIAALIMIATNLTTCWAVTERVLLPSPKPLVSTGRFDILRQIYRTLRNLPPRIQAICWAQFWSWIGWFPFLFYNTTWIGETYFRYEVGPDAEDSNDVLGDIGRIGSTALVIYSTITFAGAFILPLLVKSPDEKEAPSQSGTLGRVLDKRPNLLTTWICGHLMFSASMILAPFATSFRFATFLVCFCGIPWAIALWAPIAFLGVEVNRLSSGTAETGTANYRRLSDASDVELSTMGDPLEDTPDDGNAAGELSGIYFGILNIYTTLPQFLGTFISSIVFAILEPGKSPELADGVPDGPPDGPNAIAVCLFIGALSTLGAAYATRRLKYA